MSINTILSQPTIISALSELVAGDIMNIKPNYTSIIISGSYSNPNFIITYESGSIYSSNISTSGNNILLPDNSKFLINGTYSLVGGNIYTFSINGTNCTVNGCTSQVTGLISQNTIFSFGGSIITTTGGYITPRVIGLGGFVLNSGQCYINIIQVL